MKLGSFVLLRPAAFMKLMFCCHQAHTEIAGFGISSKSDPLVIEEFVLVLQSNTVVTVEFDDHAIANHIEDFADQGIGPDRSFRVWIHTHPGRSAAPSMVDEDTFARCFGRCDWAAMLIQGREQENYCRIRFNAGPGGQIIIPVQFDWASLPTWLSDNAAQMPQLLASWADEMFACVRELPDPIYQPPARSFGGKRARRRRRRREADDSMYPMDLNDQNEIAALSELDRFDGDEMDEDELLRLEGMSEETRAWYNSLDRTTQESFFKLREEVSTNDSRNKSTSCDSST